MSRTSGGDVARPMFGEAAAAEIAIAVATLICGNTRSSVSLRQ